MSISLKEATEFMITNGYIHPLGQGKYKLSTKFHQEFKKVLQPLRELPSTSRSALSDQMEALQPSTIIPEGHEVPVLTDKFYFSWENRYKQFILNAKVPARLESKGGDSYQANAFSEKAMKAYRKACESGIEHDILVKSTMLYYHSSLRFKVAIGRYMEEGIWKTHYDTLLSAAAGGEQQLTDHIKQETANDQQSSYRLG